MASALQTITSVIPSLGKAKLLLNSNDDVVICSSVRTALTKVSLEPNFGSQSLYIRADTACSPLGQEGWFQGYLP